MKHLKHCEALISDKARADMESIYDLIAETFQAPNTAARQYDRIANAILSTVIDTERLETRMTLWGRRMSCRRGLLRPRP